MFTGIDYLHRRSCLFSIIASEIKKIFRAERMKGYGTSFSLCPLIHVKEEKNCSDFCFRVNLNTVNFRFIKRRLEIKQRA